MSVRVRFTTARDELVEAVGESGDSLLTLAQGAGLPLEGTCESQMACSTCHVVIDPEWFAKLPPANEDEEDMLDLAAGVRRTSRLACQIVLDESLDGLSVAVPADSHDARRF